MKTCKVLLLGYGVAGKAFARILNKTHESIAAEKGIDVKVVGITTGSRGCLYEPDGIDLAEATRQLEEKGAFDLRNIHFIDHEQFFSLGVIAFHMRGPHPQIPQSVSVL